MALLGRNGGASRNVETFHQASARAAEGNIHAASWFRGAHHAEVLNNRRVLDAYGVHGGGTALSFGLPAAPIPNRNLPVTARVLRWEEKKGQQTRAHQEQSPRSFGGGGSGAAPAECGHAAGARSDLRRPCTALTRSPRIPSASYGQRSNRRVVARAPLCDGGARVSDAIAAASLEEAPELQSPTSARGSGATTSFFEAHRSRQSPQHRFLHAAGGDKVEEMLPRSYVKQLMRAVCDKLEASLRAQQLDHDRCTAQLVSSYEHALRHCTCARSARRDELHLRSHQGMQTALAQFHLREREITASLAAVDSAIQAILSRLDKSDGVAMPCDGPASPKRPETSSNATEVLASNLATTATVAVDERSTTDLPKAQQDGTDGAVDRNGGRTASLPPSAQGGDSGHASCEHSVAENGSAFVVPTAASGLPPLADGLGVPVAESLVVHAFVPVAMNMNVPTAAAAPSSEGAENSSTHRCDTREHEHARE